MQRQSHRNLGIPLAEHVASYIYIYISISPPLILSLRFALARTKEKAPACEFVVAYTSSVCTHYAKVSIRLRAWHGRSSETVDSNTFSHTHPHAMLSLDRPERILGRAEKRGGCFKKKEGARREGGGYPFRPLA